MRIAHLSDLHLLDGPRLPWQREALTVALGQALKRGVDLWLVTGDLSGRTVPHEATVAERALLFSVIAEMSSAAPVVVLYGNHDKAGDLDPLRTIGGHGVLVFDRPGAVELDTPGGRALVFALPYPWRRLALAREHAQGLAEATAEVSRLLSSLVRLWAVQAQTARARGLVPVLAAHAQVSGAQLAGGEVLQSTEPELSAGDLALMAPAYGALGHIHARQEMAPGCWYAGSPWPTEHGEHQIEAPGWLYVDTDAGTVEAVPLPSFRLLTLTWELCDGSWSGPGLDELERLDAAERERCEVRARFVLPAAQAKAALPFVAGRLDELRALGVGRIVEERRYLPGARARAPEVVEAVSLPAKLDCYWDSLEASPGASERADALDLLERLVESRPE